MSDDLTTSETDAATPAATETLAPPTPAELDDLRAKAAKADEHWDRLLRQGADFENFKKRAARDRQEDIRYANKGLLDKLIPVLDNFDMAMAAANNAQTANADALKVGVSMIHSQFKAALLESGLEELDATGKPFDPNWQEAVSHQESATVPEGHVLQQLRMGYKLRDRLLRPATVIVAKQPAAPATT
ncbi:MAG: nucleotide exchange factor GrpE [Verrucomicrobia bacterium]|nr:nucleotide exchange factor GrpE [Verrucomicrobiota bacterium]